MQVVKTQPTGAYATGSNSVGAVIFDKPQYDPLTIAMKMGDDLQRWADKKQAQADKDKATTASLVADLKFDQKGIYDRDEQYFMGGKDKLVEAQMKLSTLPKDSPEWKKAYYDARNSQEKYKVEVEASKTQKEFIKAAIEKFGANADKYDANKFNTWLANVRSAATPTEREKAMGENPFAPPKIGLVEATDKLMKAGKDSGAISPQTLVRDWGKTPEGERTMIEQTELLPENKRYGLAKNWMADPEVEDGVNQLFTNLPKSAQDYYIDKATKRSNADGTVYSPQEEFYGAWLESYNTKDRKETGMGYSPQQQEEADLLGRMKDEERQGAYTLIKAADAFVGKPEMLRPGKTEGGMDATMVPSLIGLSIGKTADGVDDPVLSSFRTADGKIHVMTASGYEAERGRGMKQEGGLWVPVTGYKFQDTRAYRSYDNVTQFWNAVNKPEGVGNGALRYADSKKARSGDGVTIDAEKLVGGMTPEQKAKQDAIYGKRLQVVNVPGATSAEQTLGGKVKVGQPAQEKPKQDVGKKEIRKADIPSKAKAAGYTVAEYTKLLTDKGIKIID